MVNKKRKNGFTIVELVIVIAVIAVLAAVLIPTFANLIKKANLSADMIAVKEMNTILSEDEILNGKPTTVVEAQEILKENGVSDFVALETLNTFYWVGSENRVILWTWDDSSKESGEVVYPDELVKKYDDMDVVSIDWKLLEENHGVEFIQPEGEETVLDALIGAIAELGIDDQVTIKLPKNTTLEMSESDFKEFYSATCTNAGIGKNVTIDLNGGTIDGESSAYLFYVFPQGSLTFCNGVVDVETPTASGCAAFQVTSGASLVLRDIDLTAEGYATFFPSSEASEIIFDNCNIDCGNSYFGLMTNGKTSNNVKVIIKDTVFTAHYTHGVILNVNSTTYIENSTITAPVSAISIRAGHIEILNSKLITNDPEPGAYKWDEFTHFDSLYHYWNDGNKMPAACLVLGDHSQDITAYSGDVDCILEKVEFISADLNKVPTVLLAAKYGKNVSLNYDASSNVGTYVLYDYPHAEGNGSISVNGTTLSFSEFILPEIVTKTFSTPRFEVPTSVGTFNTYTEYDVSILDVVVDGVNILEAFKQDCKERGVELTDAQWATAKFAPGSEVNKIKTLKYNKNAE